MRAPSFLAGLAALSLNVAVPDRAVAQPPQSPDSTRCVEGQEPPCYLTMEHFDNLKSQIEALKSLIISLQASLAEAKSAAGKGDEGAASRMAALEAELARYNERLGSLEDQLRELQGSAGAVQWSVMARARGAVGAPSDKTAVPVDVDAAVGYRDGKSGLGAEVGAGIGGWATEGEFPFAGHVRGALTGSWPVGRGVDLGFGLGAEYTYLENPNGDGGSGLGTVGPDLRLKFEGFCLRAGLDFPFSSDLARTSGPFIGGGLGYCGEKTDK